jgi:hypothetical protein
LVSFGQRKTENLVIVTLDGMRWQEVFQGMDEQLAKDSTYTKGYTRLQKQFGGATPLDRRERLLPFFWKEIAQKGQLYGNRNIDSKVNNANPHWFSYPGYNEIFTGYPDSNINSNDKINNPHQNVLEFIQRDKKFEGRVAAFSTWDVFPYIFNEDRSKIYVNSNHDTLAFDGPIFDLLNQMQRLVPEPVGLRPDALTYFAARSYFLQYNPGVLYIAFDETDDFAHAGNYDQYLLSAHAADKMIGDLWNLIQTHPTYRDKTTLLITTDHGRGDLRKSDWRHHGRAVSEAGQIWVGVIGPDTPPLGEMANSAQLYQMQIAPTLARFLGLQFVADHPLPEIIQSFFNDK